MVRDVLEPDVLRGTSPVLRGLRDSNVPWLPDLAFVGPKEEAEAIKQRLRTFLCEELKLELSEEKTLLTHTRDSAAKFLNYEITTIQSNTKQTRDKNGYKGRKVNGTIGLKVPRKVVEEKCKRYMRKGKPIHRAELLNESDYTIIATYQLEYRG